jgi:hypothetical protein
LGVERRLAVSKNRDLSRPSKYQADVYLGFDAKAGDYIAHWLDQFGAAGARVVASGGLRGLERSRKKPPRRKEVDASGKGQCIRRPYKAPSRMKAESDLSLGPEALKGC